MKGKDLAKKYGVNHDQFWIFLEDNKLKHTPTFASFIVDDELVDEYVSMYHRRDEIKKEKELQKETEKQKQIEEETKKKKAMAEMLITSGFNFDGYTITKYSGYISGDDAVSVERGLAVFGLGAENVKDKLMDSLVTIRRNALRELKEAAYALGCNAVIGVDFDYLTLDPQTADIAGGTTYQPYIFGVTANGNAVIIEKNTDITSSENN